MKEMLKIMFSSKSTNWRTPPELYKQLDDEFHFTLDVCPPNHVIDSLSIPWSNNICYMNPPYGHEIIKWVEKAWLEMTMNNVTTVALLPARTDTKWFWDYCIKQEIRLIKGRIRFLNDDKDEMPAPFPSLIVVFKP
jgi:hypothetical protein